MLVETNFGMEKYMAGNAGPNGSGLLPPGVGEETDEELEQRDDSRDPSGGSDDDLEGVPPVEEDEDDEEVEGEEEDDENDDRRVSLEEIERRLEEKFQRKFDRAVSKAVRNLELKHGARRSPKPEEEEEADDDRPVRPARGAAGRSDRRGDSPNVTTIRLLARDVISDEMDEAGKQERSAVKRVVDSVVPYVNWDLVDDESEFVENLVGSLKTVASDLVKTGSDRKVAQLKKAGVLQQRPGQPGSSPQTGPRGQVAKKLEQGAAAAGRRFPAGKRSLHGR